MKYTIHIVPDVDPVNPREWDNLGTMLYTSTRYTLGDRRVSVDEIEAVMRRKDVFWLPVYAYIHGSTLLNTTGFSCRWDSGQCGIIYAEKPKIRKAFKVRSNAQAELLAKKCFEAEVGEYSKYCNGEFCGYHIVDETGDVVDACYGFSSEKDAREAAEEAMRARAA